MIVFQRYVSFILSTTNPPGLFGNSVQAGVITICVLVSQLRPPENLAVYAAEPIEKRRLKSLDEIHAADNVLSNRDADGSRMDRQLNRFESLSTESCDIPLLDSQPIDAELGDSANRVEQATMLQPTPYLAPRGALAPGVQATESANLLSSSVFTSPEVEQSLLGQAKRQTSGFGVDYVQGEEGFSNVASDVGSLLGKSNRALGVGTQKRTPIVNDPRVRSSRIGSLAASGSHWVPARVDLDTVLSKIDSRQVSDVVIIPGPYSSLYGPGFQFVDFELARSPRYENGYETHGRSSVDYKSNGDQVFGQQTLLAGDSDWGVRASYAHRRGNDYLSGDGDQIPASYKSREFSLAYGEDLGDGRSIEFSLLRLDQTDIQFPGYVFDIDYLVTDGYSVDYIDEHCELSDRFETEVWYNRTRFNGNAQDPQKRQQFPFLEDIQYIGTTDVDSLSTGYRQGWTWGGGGVTDSQFTLGHDLRFIKQELNEISSGVTTGRLEIPFENRNSPIPNSFSVNPGLFAEFREPIMDTWNFKSGARLDYAQTDIVDTPQKLSEVGVGTFPATYAEIVGTDQYQQEFYLWSLYGSLEHQINEDLVGSCSLGYAERPPTLTELYAAQPFVLLLQNGLNNITGDPTLEKEKLLQFDVMLDYTADNYKVGIRGFHAWAYDYVTFENTSVTENTDNQVTQVNLRSVNTDLATLAGMESFAELFPQQRMTPFATMRYVDGRDRSRDGNFATKDGSADSPSVKVPNKKRGFFSGILGADDEPLPGIIPLETRLGLRMRNAVKNERWNLELAARIVDRQNRVATSLLESATPGFTVWDLRGTFRPLPRRDLTMVAGIENFTDKQYREHLDFRSVNGSSVFQPGVNFYVGADASY